MITRSRKISVDDYPEHLNPFYDDENEELRNNRFNTTGRRRARPSLKDAWDRGPTAALDVAVPVRGPTPARPPPPRLSMSPPPPPPSETQRSPPQRPVTLPPPPHAEPAPAASGKPARRRFSFSRTLDAGSRLLLSPALLRRFRPGAAPASQPPPKDSPTRPPPLDLRASMRRSQSQAIPTITDESGLSSRAGSNWTLAEGGVPHRMSGARPKKRKAPPPPVPVSAAATAPPLETVAVNVTDTEAQSNTAPLPRGGETTTPDVSAEPKPEDQAVSVTEETTEPRVSGTSSPEDVVIRVRGSADVQAEGEQRISEGVAPLAQGEDTAAYDGDSTGDVSRQADDARPEVGEQQEVPSLEAAVLAVGQVESNNEVTSTSDSNTSEGQVSSDAGVPTKQMTGSEEEPPSTVADETGNDDSENVQRTIINGESISDSIELQNAKQEEIVERTLAVAASKEELSVKSPIVLTLTVQVNKEATEPVSEGSVVAQEATSSPKKEEDGHQLVIESQPGEQVPCPTSSQLQTAIASEQSTKEDREGSAADNEKSVAPQEEPRKSALETFREEYLAEHYKRCLPVLQITESDLADDKDESRSLQKKEDTMLNKLPGALPVLHISEEDLRDPPETKTNDDRGTSTDDSKTAEMGEHDSSVQKTTSRMSMDCGERPCKESPKPPTRYSSGQELNSKIYFRVLPPLDRGAGTPQLKTFASPNSPPGRKVKPEPSVRNGVAATHQNDVRTNVPGDVSPPRTKSPLPTPRRRHQQIPTPVSDM